jgi:branched-chain amino acid transport system ATP-binding protein
MLLELRDVRVHFGGIEALRGVSLDVAQGSIVSLVGANGAGKSTTLRSICGLKQLSSGEIWFEGERIDRATIRERVEQGIALVPEGRRVFPHMSVLENLRMGAYLRRDETAVSRDLAEVLELFPVLRERKKQAAGTLSGGEQQMVAIGRALMARPTLLLMDEPTLGLSPVMCDEIATIVTRINKQGTTVLLVEQNVRLAFSVAQKAYVLELGQIKLAGDTAELLNNEHVRAAYLGT